MLRSQTFIQHKSTNIEFCATMSWALLIMLSVSLSQLQCPPDLTAERMMHTLMSLLVLAPLVTPLPPPPGPLLLLDMLPGREELLARASGRPLTISVLIGQS